MTYWGPFREYETGSTPLRSFVTERFRYRQKAPYTQPLPYQLWKATGTYVPNLLAGPGDAGCPTAASLGIDVINSDALERAYQEFKNAALGVNTQLASDYAERRKTMEMLNMRLGDMLRFTFKIVRGDFLGAAGVLKIPVMNRSSSKKKAWMKIRKVDKTTKELRFKRGLKNFGSNFLEYHFGWEPLVKDIYDALKILTENPNNNNPIYRVSGKGSYKERPAGVPYCADYGIAANLWKEFCGVEIVGSISVDNPNSLLLNRLGVINPITVLWEVVPFSFVVDWFVNVQSVLSQYTDFVGLSITNASTSFINRGCSDQFVRSKVNPYDRYEPFQTVKYWEKRSVFMKRQLGITKPSIAVKQLKLPSVTRGLTSASLLAQFLSTHK